MKKIRASLALFALLGIAALAPAQVLLNDFSATNPTFLPGDWSGQQGAGVYSFIGSTDDTMGAEFVGTWNLTGYTALAFTAQIDEANNTATSFAITLLNDNGESATGNYLVSSFNTLSFSTVEAPLTTSGGFDFAHVTSWRISGGEFLGMATLSLTAGGLSVVSAVPEPSTCAVLAGFSVLGFAGWRRRSRRG